MNLLLVTIRIWQRVFCRKEIGNVTVYLQSISALMIFEDCFDHLAVILNLKKCM